MHARGLLLAEHKNRLAENGGYIKLNQHWAYGFFKRIGFLQRKPTTAKSKFSVEDFAAKKREFLNDVVTTVDMEEIPAELILNWDQTGIRLVPSSSWTMEQRSVNRVEMVGQNDKRQITAVFCGSLQGDFLPVQLIYKGKTSRCHPHFEFPPGWHVTHSPNHWSTEATMLQYIEHIVEPYARSVRDMLYTATTPGLIIMDNFKGQVTEKVSSLLEKFHLHVCLLPANTTDLLQPKDISVNKPVKSFLKEQFSIWYSEQLFKQFEDQSDVPLEDVTVDPVDLSLGNMKNIGAKWLVEAAKYITDNPQFTVNGFIHAGICQALDGQTADDELDELLCEMDSNLEGSTTSDDHDEEIEPNEELCTSHQQVAFDNSVVVVYSSTDDED